MWTNATPTAKESHAWSFDYYGMMSNLSFKSWNWKKTAKLPARRWLEQNLKPLMWVVFMNFMSKQHYEHLQLWLWMSERIPNVLVIVKQENRNAHWRHVWARKHYPHKRQMDCGQMRLRSNANTLVFMVRDPYRIGASACAMAPCVISLPRKQNTAPECFLA